MVRSNDFLKARELIVTRTAFGSPERQAVVEIVGDLFSTSSVGEIADKANRRRSRWHRLPYGVPLCIGFLGYLLFLYY